MPKEIAAIQSELILTQKVRVIAATYMLTPKVVQRMLMPHILIPKEIGLLQAANVNMFTGV